MPLEPITRKEQFLSRAAGGPGLELKPITREEHFLQEIIDSGGSGGGAVASVNGQTGAVILDAGDVGAAPAETVVEVSGTTPTIEPQANTIYQCGELTSLTIDDPGNIKYSIIFYSGATATTTVGIANFTAEANKRYKITVEDGYATYDSWPYTPAP